MPHESADRRVETGCAGLSLGLDGLLEVVEVERDRVRADHLDERADVLRAQGVAVVLRDELRDADVRDDERLGRALAHDRIRAAQARVAQRRALAADADPEAMSRRGLGERRVHSLRARVAAGHPGDHQRKGEGVAEETGREVDPGGVRRRQSVVQQVHVVPAGRPCGLDVLLGGDPEVLGLAPLYRVSLRCGVIRRRHRAGVCAVRRRRGRGSH